VPEGNSSTFGIRRDPAQPGWPGAAGGLPFASDETSRPPDRRKQTGKRGHRRRAGL